MRSFIKMFHMYKQTTNLMLLSAPIQTVLNLMGYCENPVLLTGEVMDEVKLLQDGHDGGNGLLICAVWIHKLFLTSYFHNYDDGVKAVDVLKHCDLKSVISFAIIALIFHSGLVLVAVAREKGGHRRLNETRKFLKKLKYYANYCPENVLNKVSLLEAEIDVLKNRLDDAMIKYEESMALALQEGNSSEYALACERAARSLIFHKRHIEAIPYLSKAITAYEEWGAKAKVEATKRHLTALGASIHVEGQVNTD
jgi:hypothetical protein